MDRIVEKFAEHFGAHAARVVLQNADGSVNWQSVGFEPSDLVTGPEAWDWDGQSIPRSWGILYMPVAGSPCPTCKRPVIKVPPQLRAGEVMGKALRDAFPLLRALSPEHKPIGIFLVYTAHVDPRWFDPTVARFYTDYGVSSLPDGRWAKSYDPITHLATRLTSGVDYADAVDYGGKDA